MPLSPKAKLSYLSTPWPQLLSWLTVEALPLWATTGFDAKRQAFHEKLTPDGKVIEGAARRLTVQARQIYVYARAAFHGWRSEGSGIVAAAAESMIRDYLEADGAPGWVFSVDPQGKVVDAKRDLYAHAFALFGLAAAAVTTSDKKYLDVADRTLSFLNSNMKAKSGGYVSQLPDAGNVLHQNPHMHLLEALLALHEVDPSRGYDARAKEIFRLFKTRLFQQKTGLLTECFDENWAPLAGERGHYFEPGHQCEWLWLLDRCHTLLGVDAAAFTAPLTNAVEKWGISPKSLLWAEVGEDGKPINTSSRTWSHTEAVKAALVSAAPDKWARADRWLDVLYNRFLKDAHPGGWQDKFSAEGKCETDDMPASTFYHIVCALSEYALRHPASAENSP